MTCSMNSLFNQFIHHCHINIITLVLGGKSATQIFVLCTSYDVYIDSIVIQEWFAARQDVYINRSYRNRVQYTVYYQYSMSSNGM